MKNFRLALAMLAAMAAFSGCQKEMGSDSEPETAQSFNVTVTSESTVVKTAMGGDDTYVDWKEGDAISLLEIVDGALNGSYSSTATVITAGTPNTAAFTVPVSGVDPQGSSYMYVACYPAGAVTKPNANFQYSISANQTLASDGGFDPAADVLIGKPLNLSQRITSEDSFSTQFHRAGTVGKLTLKGLADGEKIMSVKVTLPETVKVTGRCTVDLSTAESTIAAYNSVINLTSEEGIVAEETGTPVYFRCLAGTWPAGSTVQFDVVTDKNAYRKQVTLPTDYEFIESGLTKLTANLGNGTTVYDPNDYMSMYNNGIDFTICGVVINKATYGQASTLTATGINTAFTTKGVYFVNNSASNRTWSYSGQRTKEMAAGTILIGRYKNYPQPVMKQTFAEDAKGCFIFNDGVMILNYRIESKDNSYGAFQGRSGTSNSGNDVFRFQDCTIVNNGNYLTSFNNDSYAVPKAMYFDNCIIRVKSKLLYGATKNKPEMLETLSFKNTVIAPYSGGATVSPVKLNGCLFDFGTTTNATTALNVEMSYCTVYDYQPASKTRGMIEVKDYANISMDHMAFYHSSYEAFDNKYYTVYGNQVSTVQTGGITVSASYSNTIAGQTMQHGTGNKSNLAPSTRSWQLTISSASQTVEAENVDATKDYFPATVIVNGDTALGGASYETKYWVK